MVHSISPTQTVTSMQTRVWVCIWLAVLLQLFVPCYSGDTNVAIVDGGALAFDVCRDGAYAVAVPPFGKCSGFRPCEAGFYCEATARHKCPEGTFGSEMGLRNNTCSGKCEAGYYCPMGSTVSRANKCHMHHSAVLPPPGGVLAIHTTSMNGTTSAIGSVYCPEGTGQPHSVPVGYYSVSAAGLDDDVTAGIENLRAGILKCPKGWYCPGPGSGLRHRCPGGTYGDSEGLSTAACTAVCPAGYYCPFGSASYVDRPCGSDPQWYCPRGSESRQPTQQGSYAVDLLMSPVSSLSSSPAAQMGGYSKAVVCPVGSYCLAGKRIPCPAGRYGSLTQMINPLCTGPCREGWFCPPGSAYQQEQVCGTDASVFCPASSGEPVKVSPGYYTHSQFASAADANAAPGVGEWHLGLRHTHQNLCEAGYYCMQDGKRYECPAGRYGATAGMTSPTCSGVCEPGYFCPPKSTRPTQNKCGHANVFCPEGSGSPRPVQGGYYSVQGYGAFGDFNGPADVRAYERKCEPGFFCTQGNKFLCRSGHYGADWLATSWHCNGPCDEGHYCPEGSISPTEVMCGAPNRYCPSNSTRPLFVSDGFYSVGGIDDARRVSQAIAPKGHYSIAGLLYVCPAGFYGEAEGLKTHRCSGPCHIPGWYCPTGSISPHMKECGSDKVYCPATTVAPMIVHTGFYTADYEYEACPPGSWRPAESAWVDPEAGISDVVTLTTRPSCQLCAQGKYKNLVGDSIALCKNCPAHSTTSNDGSECVCYDVVAAGFFMHFNIISGSCERLEESRRALLTGADWEPNMARTRFAESECEPGHYCVDGRRHRCPVGRYGALRRETRSDCQGLCATGYFCQRSSISPFSAPCGGADKICPEGSATSQMVPAGYFSNEDENELKRSTMKICPKGNYCPGDGKRYDCPAGRYADEEGTTSSTCKDNCQRGYYCEPGSPSARQYPCGSSNAYCPRGSAVPTSVTAGFYGAFSGADAFAQALWDNKNTTCSVELLCEPGYYCIAGMKFPCPPGTFGWRYGSTDENCGGKCAAGYYCPSYLTAQPDAPSHTQWPRKPHVTATPLRCGGVSFLCPRGSFYPVLVGGGNYTIGGDSTNTTRSGQEICPAGTYCSDGIVNLCPKGRFGSSPGQSVPTCTDWCPPGHYCPPGTSLPKPCPEGFYAAGAAWSCSACPGTRTTPLQCQNSRECCFRGA